MSLNSETGKKSKKDGEEKHFEYWAVVEIAKNSGYIKYDFSNIGTDLRASQKRDSPLTQVQTHSPSFFRWKLWNTGEITEVENTQKKKRIDGTMTD